jgi:hypothetical protein
MGVGDKQCKLPAKTVWFMRTETFDMSEDSWFNGGACCCCCCCDCCGAAGAAKLAFKDEEPAASMISCCSCYWKFERMGGNIFRECGSHQDKHLTFQKPKIYVSRHTPRYINPPPHVATHTHFGARARAVWEFRRKECPNGNEENEGNW